MVGCTLDARWLLENFSKMFENFFFYSSTISFMVTFLSSSAYQFFNSYDGERCLCFVGRAGRDQL